PLVHALAFTHTNMLGNASGTNTVVKLNYRPKAVTAPTPAVATPTPPAAAPVPAPPIPGLPIAPPGTTPTATTPAAAPPATAPPAQLGRTPVAVSFSPPRA